MFSCYVRKTNVSLTRELIVILKLNVFIIKIEYDIVQIVTK